MAHCCAQMLKDSGVYARVRVMLVTGWGRGSKGGKPKIRPAVEAHWADAGITSWRVGYNGGAVMAEL